MNREYNRAFIKRNKESMPTLERYDLHEGDRHWLFESGESFHGEHDSEFFYFSDSRLDKRLRLPLSCVELEFED